MRIVAVTVLAVTSGLSCTPSPEVDAPAREDARAAELVEAAARIVSFLQGDTAFSDVRMADTVTLRLSPEGGGAQVSIPRDALHDPARWVVPTPYGAQPLAPPPGMSRLTARPGVHFRCLEYTLASVAPDLAALPHVGVRLAQGADANCLQTWNMTLVFDTAGGPPRLTAALYDQWEW